MLVQPTRPSDCARCPMSLTAAADGRRTTHQSMFAHGTLATMALGSRRWVLFAAATPPHPSAAVHAWLCI